MTALNTAFSAALAWMKSPRRARWWAKGLGALLRLAGPRRSVGLKNLALALPELGENERKTILAALYDNLAWSTAETFHSLSAPEKALDWFEYDESYQYVDDLRRERKGAVLLTAHFGNWELFGGWLVRRGHPLVVIARRHDNPKVEAVTERSRNLAGIRTIGKEENMRKAVRLLREGTLLGVLADQYAGHEGVEISFFGIPTPVFPGPAALALMAGVPLVPMVSYREAPFRHRVVAAPAIVPPEGLSQQETIQAMTQRGFTALETMIRQHPEQWLWLHRRWR